MSRINLEAIRGVFSSWRARRGMLALVLALATLGSARDGAAAFEVKDASWEGTSEFLSLARERLGAARVQIVATLDFGKLSPKDGVLVLHPEQELEYAEISAFLTAGGRLALLDDLGAGDRFLKHYRIQRILAPLRPAQTLRNNPNLPLAIPAVQSVAGQEQNRHPVVSSVERLATNHPSALTNPNLTPVLMIPALGEPDATLALTGVIAGRGRLFAMADPSVLINQMLAYPGNRNFAAGLVDYLVEDDAWGERGGSLYVLTNRFRQIGHYGKPDGLSDELTQAARSVAETLEGWHRDGLPSSVARAFGAAAALGALLLLGLTSLRRYARATPSYAAPLAALAQGGLSGRAAVLSASTTDRALVVSELNEMLREELVRRAGLPALSSTQAALEELTRQGVSSSWLAHCREFLRVADLAESALRNRRRSNVTTGQASDQERRVTELLVDLERSGQK